MFSPSRTLTPPKHEASLVKRYRYPPPPILLERFAAPTPHGTIELCIWHAAHTSVLWAQATCGCEFDVVDRDTYVKRWPLDGQQAFLARRSKPLLKPA